jgi:hypothetical protein
MIIINPPPNDLVCEVCSKPVSELVPLSTTLIREMDTDMAICCSLTLPTIISLLRDNVHLLEIWLVLHGNVDHAIFYQMMKRL